MKKLVMENDRESHDDQRKSDLPERTGSDDSSGIEPGELVSALDKLKSGKPEAVAEFMTMFASGPMMNPLVAKMDGQHITSMLKIVADHDSREFELRQTDATQLKHDRGWAFAVFTILVLLIVFVLVQFKDQPDVLIPILTGIGGSVFGGIGGYGFGKHSN